MCPFWLKINTPGVFPNQESVHWIFLKLNLIAGLKWIRMIILDFCGKFLLCQSLGHGWFLGSKSSFFFNFSQKLCIGIF